MAPVDGVTDELADAERRFRSAVPQRRRASGDSVPSSANRRAPRGRVWPGTRTAVPADGG
ncbi:hypothetical protein KCH_01500 [Kitasatospora cheerisanensis KCTC 2395]|uniref:Uncharacterized protein n=1 Tax=Kitasatospora cheerisanensis KCTC 2395 TaxID=1348663 RepID=A0A066Z2S0_9ACTN|nr:hypothetical protein KCH_01500 [Kitasatospora cheerisanensis KCTC 2395]